MAAPRKYIPHENSNWGERINCVLFNHIEKDLIPVLIGFTDEDRHRPDLQSDVTFPACSKTLQDNDLDPFPGVADISVHITLWLDKCEEDDDTEEPHWVLMVNVHIDPEHPDEYDTVDDLRNWSGVGLKIKLDAMPPWAIGEHNKLFRNALVKLREHIEEKYDSYGFQRGSFKMTAPKYTPLATSSVDECLNCVLFNYIQEDIEFHESIPLTYEGATVIHHTSQIFTDNRLNLSGFLGLKEVRVRATLARDPMWAPGSPWILKISLEVIGGYGPLKNHPKIKLRHDIRIGEMPAGVRLFHAALAQMREHVEGLYDVNGRKK